MDLVLPEKDRQAFKEPIGRELADSELDSFDAQTAFITVGDVVSLTFRKHGITPILSIYDGRTERREMTEFARLVEDEPKIEVVNPAGEITTELVGAIRGCIEGSGGLILVDGEEDLALLPCVLYAPEGAVVIYGWPGRGMKAVDTDGPSKAYIEKLLESMEELI